MNKNIDGLFCKEKKTNIEEIVKNINIDDFNISKILQIKDSIILNNDLLGENFYQTFTDNLNYITRIISIKKSGGELSKKQEKILKNIEDINKQAIDTTKEIIDDLFKEFLPKNFKTENGISYIKKYGNLPFLNEILYKENSLSIQGKNIARDLYLLSVNYIISYYRWLENISENFTQSLTKKTIIDTKIQVKIQNILNHIKCNENDKTALVQLLYIFYLSIDEHTFTTIEKNIKGARIKTFSSAIKKLLKSHKYRNQFLEEGILQDQIGLLCEFKNKKELENISKKIYKEYKGGETNISKFNDRGIIEKKHDNKDTVKGINPFANIGIIKDKIPLGEISLRYKNDNVIENIIKKFKRNKDLEYFFRELIIKLDYLNHEIYKLSQDIKILRQIIIDIGTLPKQTYIESRTKRYLEKKVNKIKSEITNHIQKIIKENNIDIYIKDSLNQKIIEYIIYDMLEEKLETVIHDLTWEKVLNKIKLIDSYKTLNDTKKRDYLKRLSLRFRDQIGYDKDKKGKNVLRNYNDNIKKIYKEYKRIYNKIFKTSIFYKQVNKDKNTLKNIIQMQLEASKKLYDTFNKGK